MSVWNFQQAIDMQVHKVPELICPVKCNHSACSSQPYNSQTPITVRTPADMITTGFLQSCYPTRLHLRGAEFIKQQLSTWSQCLIRLAVRCTTESAFCKAVVSWMARSMRLVTAFFRITVSHSCFASKGKKQTKHINNASCWRNCHK